MTRIIGYDLQAQIRGVRAISQLWKSIPWPEWMKSESKTEDGKPRDPSHRVMKPLYAALPWVLGAALVGALAWLLARRKRRRVVPLQESQARAQTLYRQLERVLEKRGRGRPPHVTPEAHAQQLSAQGFAAAEAVVALTDSYVRARFGDERLTREQLQQLRQRLKEVERAA